MEDLSDLLNIIDQSESMQLEFKTTAIPYGQLLPLMLSFANTDGGYIIFGVGDNGKVLGLTKDKVSLLLGNLNRISDSISDEELIFNFRKNKISGKEIVWIKIEKSEEEVLYQGKRFYRSGSAVLNSTSFSTINISYNCFTTQLYTVSKILSAIDEGKFKAVSKTEKSFKGQNVEAQSRFIESLLLSQPQTTLFLDGSQKTVYVLDGMKMLSTLKNFCKGKFSLHSLFYDELQIEGDRYQDLPSALRHRLLNYSFSANVINPGVSRMQRFDIYTTINRDVQNFYDYRRILYPETFSIVEEKYNKVKILFLCKSKLMGGNSNFMDTYCRLAVLLYLGCSKEKRQRHVFDNIEACVNYILEDSIDTFSAFGNDNLINCFRYISEHDEMLSIFRFFDERKKLIFLAAISIALTFNINDSVLFQRLNDNWKSLERKNIPNMNNLGSFIKRAKELIM